MGSAACLDLFPIYNLRPCPAFGRLQNDHWPARARFDPPGPGIGLNLLDLGDDLVECRSHLLVHLLRFISLDKVWCIAVATEELLQFLTADPAKHRRVGDLVAIE